MPKLGYISGSRAASLMSGGRGKEEFGKGFFGLCELMAAEMVGWEVSPDIDNLDLQRGRELQPEAILLYERQQEVIVNDTDVWHEGPQPFTGCTPDGIIVGGESLGLLEVKCPRDHNHLKNILEDVQVEDYKYQIQWSLYVLDLDWCHFVSYCRGAPMGLRLKMCEVRRDDDLIKKMHVRAGIAVGKATEIADRLYKRSQEMYEKDALLYSTED